MFIDQPLGHATRHLRSSVDAPRAQGPDELKHVELAHDRTKASNNVRTDPRLLTHRARSQSKGIAR
jgi:hypothetical protein